MQLKDDLELVWFETPRSIDRKLIYLKLEDKEIALVKLVEGVEVSDLVENRGSEDASNTPKR